MRKIPWTRHILILIARVTFSVHKTRTSGETPSLFLFRRWSYISAMETFCLFRHWKCASHAAISTASAAFLCVKAHTRTYTHTNLLWIKQFVQWHWVHEQRDPTLKCRKEKRHLIALGKRWDCANWPQKKIIFFLLSNDLYPLRGMS